MAFEKKETPKNYVPDIVFLLVGLFIISVIFARLQEYLEYWDINTLSFWEALKDFFILHVWPIIKISAVVLSAGAIIGMMDTYRKLRRLNIEERKVYRVGNASLSLTKNFEEQKNNRWERIKMLTNSTNESDWRLAIIEADGMLDELLRSAGYHGESTGEMLKAVEKSDFLAIESAWEGHKMRNKIAHSAGSFQLNEREAKQTIAHFEAVFKEFEII
ncbi:MAG: hypothetical protein ABIF06_01585 [bacterium]